MEIQYLVQLNNNPTIKFGNGQFTLKPLSAKEITNLETDYNNGNQFPVALRELLTIAGESCYVLDYGPTKTQDQIQLVVRKWLNYFKLSITRPFFAIDVYNGGDQFLFVYLDESATDPIVYEAFIPDAKDGKAWINSVNCALSDFLNSRLETMLSGYNPF